MGYLIERACGSDRLGVEIGRGTTASFRRAPPKRPSRSSPQGDAIHSLDGFRSGLLVLHGLSLQHLSSGHCHLDETLGGRRNLRCGSLRRKLVSPTLVESENFAVGQGCSRSIWVWATSPGFQALSKGFLILLTDLEEVGFGCPR